MPKYIKGQDADDEGRSVEGSAHRGDEIDQEVDKHPEIQRRSRKQFEADADREYLDEFFGNCQDEED